MVGTLIFLASGLLVVPVSKMCAEAVHCVHTPQGAFLACAPSVECFVGPHRRLTMILAVLCPLYFFLLIPYAVVSGDRRYVQRHELFAPWLWRFNANRKATVVYLGPMHPHGDTAFRFLLLDLLAKISLPVVVIETASTPGLQIGLVTSIG